MGTQRFIQNIEDQIVNLAINGRSFTFHFFPFRGLMYMDVIRKGITIYSGKRVMANQWMLSPYIAEEIGNIRFETYAADEEDYVWWEDFNKKFRLVSYTDEEIKRMEAEETLEEK